MAEVDGKDIAAVILAAGMGLRMKSDTPKVLHPLLGEPMITYVVRALEQAGVSDMLAVLGHGREQVEQVLGERVRPVYQEKQLGTGHALLMALPQLLAGGKRDCLVVCGDTPLLSGETLAALWRRHSQAGAAATVLTAQPEDPAGYGRILREDGRLTAIVEEKDATAEQRLIREINAGAYCFDLSRLGPALEQLKPANAQGEYYLTDVIAYFIGRGQTVASWQTGDPQEIRGVNDRVQLARAQDGLRRRILESHMLAGVTVEEPAATIVGPLAEIGRDTTLETGCQIFGRTVIGEACLIGPRSRITGCRIGKGTWVNQSTMEECETGENCRIGPYTYLRPGCVLAGDVKAGGFVEMKKVRAGDGAKIPHLSYMGDCDVGRKVNVGAGTITCNYDGKDKFPTVIGDEAFIGSNTNLVAPVRVGDGAYVAAGSTITKDVPPRALGVARSRQTNIGDWQKRPPQKSG
jgi:bifunctional UDP-N-acetylglucosamine pyrophosphorylase/glucosamine-1-phosphate N-acetyltransferase